MMLVMMISVDSCFLFSYGLTTKDTTQCQHSWMPSTTPSCVPTCQIQKEENALIPLLTVSNGWIWGCAGEREGCEETGKGWLGEGEAGVGGGDGGGGREMEDMYDYDQSIHGQALMWQPLECCLVQWLQLSKCAIWLWYYRTCIHVT